MANQRPLTIIDGQVQELPVGDTVVVEVAGQASGGVIRLPVVDDDVQSLLGSILKELRMMNTHLASMTGEKFTRNDIGG